MPPKKQDNLQTRIRKLLEQMTAGVYERDHMLALALLSAVAGESIFLLGLPGVGKSLVARRLKLAFDHATVFEYLMSRFSTPDEIFGPVSISKLKDEDRYERVTAGFLPEAEVVFLDEIWKAGSAIQNSLLTVLNEKIYLNGNREMRLPLKGIIAASNELPAEDEGLEALWDRFLLRCIVHPIEQKEHFLQLLRSDAAPEEVCVTETISHAEYEAIETESRGIALPENILDGIALLREKLNSKMKVQDPEAEDANGENRRYYISDRRWKKAVHVLKVSAYLNGRVSVDFSDLPLLVHMLWNDDGCIPEIQRAVSEVIVDILFKDLLEQYKSLKRHAAVKKTDKRLFSPDKVNYVIQCDGGPLKIKIRDYEKIKSNPDKIYFGAETSDGDIVLQTRGFYAMRFVKEGCIEINGYNYLLRTVADEQLSRPFLNEIGDTFDTVAQQLYWDIDHNLFTASSDLRGTLREVIGKYKQRLEQL